MKITLKLVLSIIAIMACILSVSRYFIVRQSFEHSLEKSGAQNYKQHILQRYYIESNIISNIEIGEEITNEMIVEYVKALYRYMGENSERITLYNKQEIIFSNFDEVEKLDFDFIYNNQDGDYYIREVNSRHYMLFSSNITINNSVIYIVNIYDISDIYAERDRQMKEVIFSDIIILGIASVFIIIFSAVMTKPIKILNNKAKKNCKWRLFK